MSKTKGWTQPKSWPMAFVGSQREAREIRRAVAASEGESALGELHVDVLPSEGWYVWRNDVKGKVHYLGWRSDERHADKSERKS